MSKKLIVVRVQTPEGQKRLEVAPDASSSDLLEKTSQLANLRVGQFSLYRNRDKTGGEVKRGKRIKTYNIRHGDMLYLFPKANGNDFADSVDDFTNSTNSAASINDEVAEDEIDQFLTKVDGKIYRQKDPQLCRHGSSGKCVHCVPLEPYDESYLNSLEPPIKHMSFHAYLRKQTGGVDKGKYLMLENLNCRIRPGCSGHPPWPDGICTKCQPSAVTLLRQEYRHIDNVLFLNPHLFERFLNYWRNTGAQRLGFLYGRYEYHDSVPLGIRACVSAIYEPPQKSLAHSIELLEDPRAEIVDHIAAKLGLRKVGWIFTDLMAEDLRKGTVKHVRNMDAHFLSAEECMMAGEFQNQYPNPCKLSKDGVFGSKFATVIVTGDVANQIHTEAYQVSNQCMALVRDQCLIPTKDAPELGYIKESSSNQYIPDVFYTQKDSYGNEVKQLARPLPVEYLIIDVPAGFPMEPKYVFNDGDGKKKFPVENREMMGEVQDFGCLARYMQQYSPNSLLEATADFHLLLFLATMDMLPLKDDMDLLLEAIRKQDRDLARDWSKGEQWNTLMQLLQAHAGEGGLVADASASFSGVTHQSDSSTPSTMWSCQHCTYLNQPQNTECEICGLPKQ